jgi:EAL domain-containing protein (putative c-di-GMP-specific phosphodiesterase class I)
MTREHADPLGEEAGIHLLYQPVYTLPTGPVGSVEALIRSGSPTPARVASSVPSAPSAHGNPNPEVFCQVLPEALGQLVEWRSTMPMVAEVCLAVQLPALEFRDEQLLGRVDHLLATHGLPGSALRLEFMEYALTHGLVPTVEIIAELRDLGVGPAIADFGTEYTSFALVKRSPIDVLKIHRSLIISLGEKNNANETVIAALVALAKAFGLSSIAEGWRPRSRQPRRLRSGATWRKVRGTRSRFLLARCVKPLD